MSDASTVNPNANEQHGTPSSEGEARLHEEVKYEESDVSLAGVIAILIAIALVFAGVFFLCAWMLMMSQPNSWRAASSSNYAVPADQKPAPPRLEPLDFEGAAATDVFAKQLKLEHTLHTYGDTAVDDFVHIPIEARDAVGRSIATGEGGIAATSEKFWPRRRWRIELGTFVFGGALMANPQKMRSLVTCLVFAVCSAATSFAYSPPALKGVGFDQRLNQQIPLDVRFTDETGKPVQLGDYFGKKPVILVLAYYQCPRLCTLVLNGLVQGMLEMPLDVGKDFNVVTVSFDPREKWQLAASKKESYLRRYGRPGAENGWHFLTGEQDQIKRLTEAAGFRYRFDPVQNQFIHASGIMILTPTGKISRYFYDVHYPGRDLRLGLVEASNNKIGSPVDQILLYCFHYDATVGRYTASIMNIIRVMGVGTMLVICGFVVFLQRRHVKRAAAEQANASRETPHREPMSVGALSANSSSID